MRLVRLLGLLVIGWMVLALGAGALGVGADERTASTYFIPRRALQDAIPFGRIEGPKDPDYGLVDRATGKITPLTFPQGPAWSLLSVSPWRDRQGNLEAVGRWVHRPERSGEFCGLGLLRLPDATVTNQVTLDVLPIGKPCWMPDRPGEVLFPAAGGKLYRLNVAAHDRDDTGGESPRSAGQNEENPAVTREVTWGIQPPGAGATYFSDPAWPPEPEFRHLLFVSLSLVRNVENQPVIVPPKLWWLKMNDQGDAIVAAGRLNQSGRDEPENDMVVFERMPNVFIGENGQPRLVYLSRASSWGLWQLRSATLELDHETSLPRIRQRAGEPAVLADGVAPAALVVSADGKSVYAMTGPGQTFKHSIPR